MNYNEIDWWEVAYDDKETWDYWWSVQKEELKWISLWIAGVTISLSILFLVFKIGQ